VHMLCAIGPRLLSTAQRDGQRGEAMGGQATPIKEQRLGAATGKYLCTPVPLYLRSTG
jgi:hypothetical protein